MYSITYMDLTELFIVKRDTFKLRSYLFALLNATLPQLWSGTHITCTPITYNIIISLFLYQSIQ